MANDFYYVLFRAFFVFLIYLALLCELIPW